MPSKGRKGKNAQQDDEVDTVRYGRAAVKPDTNIRVAPQNTSTDAGKSLGYTVLAEQEEYRSQFIAIEARNAEIQRKITHQSQMISDLQGQVTQLKCACGGYLRTRHQFLDTFKRDILNVPIAASAISAGNKAAHNVDAVKDAGLFESGARKDESMMFKTYGLSANQVLALNRAEDLESIAILNARATLKADKDNTIPQDIEEAWSTYVSCLEQNWGQYPTDEPQSDLGRACCGFWDAHRKYRG